VQRDSDHVRSERRFLLLIGQQERIPLIECAFPMIDAQMSRSRVSRSTYCGLAPENDNR
jgi:hypothetical protein